MGKGGGGKSKGKIAFTLAFAVVGGALGALSATHFTVAVGALYGATIGSTLWSVTRKQGFNNDDTNFDSDYSNDDYSRFNQVSNDISQDAVIPIIYGTRKFGGLQTWYNAYNGSRNLEKDVVICYAGIDSVYNVCANEELIKNDTNISIYNDKHSNAYVSRDGNQLTLSAGGHTSTYTLGNTEEYNAQTSLLSTVLDKIKSEAGNGWKIDGAVDDRSSKGISADSMRFNGFKYCYVDPLDKERGNAAVLDNRGYSIGTYSFYQNTIPSNYMETGSYAGCAWIRSNLIASSRLNGSNPTINTYVKGMKVKVWKNNQWVVEYSENPAWIIRDFLTNKVYGTGNWITEDMLDINSFISVANYCNEEIQYRDNNGDIRKCPRYTLNIILDSKKEPIEHLSSMLATFGGFFTIGDKISLKIEKAETPVYAFDDSTIIKDSLSIGQTAYKDTPNRYKIGYFDPSQNWTEVKVVVEDLELQQEQDEQINEKSITLAGCTSQNQALRLGRLYRDINKVCSLTCSFSVATQGMMLECGDVITVTYNDIFTNMPFRITEIQETKDGVYQLTCRQYNPSLYDDSLGATIINPTYGNIQSSLLNDVPPITELTLIEENTVNSDGSLATNIIASWNGDKITNFSSYLVSLSTDGVNYKSVGSFTDNVARIPNCVVGKTYFVCVQNVNNIGIESIPTIATINLVGDGITPPTPNNLRIKLTDTFRIIWDKVLSSNIKYYEVRTDTNYGNEENLLGKVESPELSTNIITERTGSIYVYAVSIYNKYSAPAQIDYDFPARKLYVLNANAKFQGIDLSTNSVPNNCMGVRWFITNSTDSRTVTTTDSVYFHNCNAGIYNVNACYYDYFGEGERFDADGNGKIVTVVAYIDPEVIQAESINVEKLSKTVKDAIENGGINSVNIAVKGLLGEGSALTLQEDGSYALVASNGEKLTGLFANQDGTMRLQGDYIHLTGNTQFDENVIIKGQMVAGSINCDDGVSIGAGAVTVNNQGLITQCSNGSRVLVNEDGISFQDSNGKTFSQIGRFAVGTANNNDVVQLGWDIEPKAVFCVPYSVQTMVAGYNSSNLYIKCFADNITKDSFKMRCYTTLGAGSFSVQSMRDVNSTIAAGSNSAPPDGHLLMRIEAPFTDALLVPQGATQATVKADTYFSTYIEQDHGVMLSSWVLEIYANNSLIKTITLHGEAMGRQGTVTYNVPVNTTFSISGGQYVKFRLVSNTYVRNIDRHGTTDVTQKFSNANLTCNVVGETTIASGSATYFAIG